MTQQNKHHIDRRLSVAPMMDWTDRHCRFFLRLVAPDALLFTEMVTADAIIHGDCERLLGHDVAEHPLSLQLGGSNPDKLAAGVNHPQRLRYGTIDVHGVHRGHRLQPNRGISAECETADVNLTGRPADVVEWV